MPALITPYDDNFEVDYQTLAQLVTEHVARDDVVGVVVNAVAGEGDALTSDERTKIVAAVASVAAGKHVVSSICRTTAESARTEIEAHSAAGACAVLVQAPPVFARGINLAPELAITYFAELARCGVPLIAFQHQSYTQRAYGLDLLLDILEIPNVVALKETIWDVSSYESTVRTVRRERPDVQVLCANDTLLLPCLVSEPADGLLLGFASLAVERIAELWQAVRADDLASARTVHGRLAFLRDVIYAAPALGYYSRLKAGLYLRGKVPNYRVRPPLASAERNEIIEVADALCHAGYDNLHRS